jgi:hypothetical protein
MGVREAKVEKHLSNQVTALGGITRKWVSPGHIVPDQLLFVFDQIFVVEVKTDDGGFEPGQLREQERLRKHGTNVCTVWGNTGVDQMIKDLKLSQRPLRKYYG